MRSFAEPETPGVCEARMACRDQTAQRGRKSHGIWFFDISCSADIEYFFSHKKGDILTVSGRFGQREA